LWPECSKNLIKAALYHDIHEGTLGDIPAQVKRKFYYFAKAIDRAEQVINRELGTHVPLDIEEQERLKTADVMELLWFSVEEIERGNNNFMSVGARCLGFLDQLPLEPKISEMRQQLEKRYML
jgi:5'-deoxynucleotidase YfbR-like HD superfamily hydrolase